MYCFWTSQCYFTKSYAFSFFSACDNPTFMRGKLTEVSRGQWHWGTVIVCETVLDFILDLSSVSDFGVEKTEQDDWNWRYGELFMSFITYGFIQEHLANFSKLCYMPSDRCIEIYNATVVGCAECPECLDCSGVYYCSKAHMHTDRVTWPWEAMRMALDNGYRISWPISATEKQCFWIAICWIACNI